MNAQTPFHEKAEFIAFCKTKGSQHFNGGDPFGCAMTQFFKSLYPNTNHSVSSSIIGYPYAEELHGKTIAYLKLEMYEVGRLLDCRTFLKAVKVLEE